MGPFTMLDTILPPISFLMILSYNCHLWHRVSKYPMTTAIYVNNVARREWVYYIMNDNKSRNVLAVQTLRNTVMGATLMATTTALLSTGLGAFVSSSYGLNLKTPIKEYTVGADSNFLTYIKFILLFFLLLGAFIMYFQSIRFLNHVNYMINIPWSNTSIFSPEFVADMLERSNNFYTIGNRAFYTSLFSFVWLLGPTLMFASAIFFIPLLYYLDSAPAVRKQPAKDGSCINVITADMA